MVSLLQKKRMEYQPQVPDLLLSEARFRKELSKSNLPNEIKKLFPKTCDTPFYLLEKGKGMSRRIKIGVIFSGGPAAGGHNVIAGIFDSKADLIGFLGGPSGIVENRFTQIQNVDSYRNQGGFDLIGSGRTKIEGEEMLKASLKTVQEHQLDGLVIIGGDDSNTNAAVLAEYFLQNGCKTCVIGVPKTIDGDLRSDDIEISFGFDTAAKVYSELIGNIARDALSSKKYYHFIKLMGRSASHITLECALRTQPNLALISEERKPLNEIVKEIADLIIKRFEKKKQYGVILIPEGLIEFTPELNTLDLPRDPHGNVEVSKIETEKLLIDQVQKELKKREFKGKFNAQSHFLGYEGRCAMPSNFDANYCYALGLIASLAVKEGLTGLICSVQKLKENPKKWEVKMVPIVRLIHMEKRGDSQKPVIKKTLVDIKAEPFIHFSLFRKSWEIEDQYQYPGPIQFFGGAELTDTAPLSL